MSHFITSECINCGECIAFCSEDAISETGQFYTIDSSKCTDCGDCLQYCPTDAIKG